MKILNQSINEMKGRGEPWLDIPERPGDALVSARELLAEAVGAE